MPSVYDEAEKALNQGDVFENVPFVKRRVGEAAPAPMRGLVLTAHCVCDKFEKAEEKGVADEKLNAWPVTLAPLYVPNDLGSSNAGNARDPNHMPRYFWLPAEDPYQEMFADRGRVSGASVRRPPAPLLPPRLRLQDR